MSNHVIRALMDEGLRAPDEDAAAEMASIFDLEHAGSDVRAFARRCRQEKPALFGAKNAMAMTDTEVKDSIRAMQNDAWRNAVKRETARYTDSLAKKYA